MRLATAILGGVSGSIPGALLIVAGQLITDGGDGMIAFGLGGVGLVLAGLVVGSVVGWRRHSWLGHHPALGGVIGLLAALVVTVSIAWVASGSEKDPIMAARDCAEVYELLGATGPDGELLELPALSAEQIKNIEDRIVEFERLGRDQVCSRLRADLRSPES